MLTSLDGEQVTAVPATSLMSCQEEAATSLLLHAAHENPSQDIVIRSPDTDVLVLCTGYQAICSSELEFAKMHALSQYVALRPHCLILYAFL